MSAVVAAGPLVLGAGGVSVPFAQHSLARDVSPRF